MKIANSLFFLENVFFGMCILSSFHHWSILNKVILWKKCHFLAKKCIFFEKNGNLTHWAARGSKVILEYFVWGLIFYISMKKKLEDFGGKNVRPIFLFLPPHFWPYFINFSHQTGFRQYILVYNSNIQLLYDTTLLNFLFHFGSFRPEAEPYWPPGGYLGVG